MLRLFGFGISLTEDTAAGMYQVGVHGIFEIPDLGRSVSVGTMQELIGMTGAQPHSGALEFTGGNGSKIRLTVISASEVNVEVDEDADEIFEISVMIDWSTMGIAVNPL